MSNDEWEYEYSSYEQESLYFTLDLTTHVPNALPDTQNIQSGSTSPNHSAPRAERSNRTQSDSESSGNDEEDAEDLPSLQILDLHTSNPLIKFEETVYSCYWTTDLGTQFHISAAGQTPEALRKGTVLDVLGISRARLIGKPVGLIDRHAPPPPTSTTAQKPSENIEADGSDGDENAFSTTTGPLKIPRSILKTPTSRSQASFLESLSKIKLAKGETDQVPILAIKHYSKPANSEDIKRKAEDDDRNSALVNNIDGKKRRRRRPMGVRPRNKSGAGRPGRDRIERGLGLEYQDGEPQEEGEEEDEVERGMFGPGVRRADTAVPDDEEVEDERPRLERLVTVESSANGETERETSPWRPSEVNTGYLSFQSRKEYLETVRAEAVPKVSLKPTRPPWMIEDGEGEEEGGRGRGIEEGPAVDGDAEMMDEGGGDAV